MRKINMTGYTHGSWTVTGEAGSNSAGATSWYCKCECGTIRVISGSFVRSKAMTKSCGCVKKIPKRDYEDLTGQKIGMLSVLKEAEHSGVEHHWLCACECGKQKVKRGATLLAGRREGRKTSCGCTYTTKGMKHKDRMPFGHSHQKAVKYEYTSRSKEEEVEFLLTDKEFNWLIAQDCFYCGLEPSNVKRLTNVPGEFPYTGIDRIEHSTDYVNGNVVPCCKFCNARKGTKDFEAFITELAEDNKSEYMKKINGEF